MPLNKWEESIIGEATWSACNQCVNRRNDCSCRLDTFDISVNGHWIVCDDFISESEDTP